MGQGIRSGTSIDLRGGKVLVSIGEDFTREVAERTKESLEQIYMLATDSCVGKRLILDLSQVTVIDQVGMAAIGHIDRIYRDIEKEGRICLVASPHVKRMLAMAGLKRRTYDTVNEVAMELVPA